jgi:hypothetical protein
MTIDWYAVSAVLLAIVASFAEVLSPNIRRPLADIFNRYLLLYLLLNAILAYVTYHFLPDVAQIFLKPENVKWAQNGWGRAFVAAFGYLVIIRTKVITISGTPIGVDAVYTAFASYCLSHTNILIENKEFKKLREVYSKFQGLKRYEYALGERMPIDPAMKATVEAQRKAVLESTFPESRKCKALAQILLGIVGNQDELEKALSEVPEADL